MKKPPARANKLGAKNSYPAPEWTANLSLINGWVGLGCHLSLNHAFRPRVEQANGFNRNLAPSCLGGRAKASAMQGTSWNFRFYFRICCWRLYGASRGWPGHTFIQVGLAGLAALRGKVGWSSAECHVPEWLSLCLASIPTHPPHW